MPIDITLKESFLLDLDIAPDHNNAVSAQFIWKEQQKHDIIYSIFPIGMLHWPSMMLSSQSDSGYGS